MPFTLKQAKYFVGVAEHGSFSRAATELAISQSTLTEAVKDLEGHLGLKLFERRRRGVEMTHQGHVFMRHAKAILAEISNAELSLGGKQSNLSGNINIGVSSLTSGYVLSDLLSRFRRAQPEIEVSAIEDTPEYLEHLLVGGELDVAIMLVDRLRNPAALHSELLAVSPYRLWLPLGHPLSSLESISLDDLSSEPQIVLNVEEIQDEAARLLSSFPTKPRVAFRTRSVEAVRSLVASGAGISFLPDLVYRPWSLEGDRIDSRDVSAQLPVIQVGLVWRRGASVSDATRMFLSVAQSFHAPRLR
ncbi:LysR family transcriptional regulator [Yoonia sp. SDW83-1]|uniref:LysR family transcriptional regulator n=1 Tax=Yoonia sp. SDW83-1 TaxID=3366945 RepID=UPI00398C3F88